MTSMKVKSTYVFLLVGLLLGAGITSAIFLYREHEVQPAGVTVLRESDISSSTGYMFTDPLVSVTDNSDAPEYTALQKQVTDYIQTEKNSGVSSVSVNFRDIVNSDGFSVNPSELYDPASLTKIPLMMAYYA